VASEDRGNLLPPHDSLSHVYGNIQSQRRRDMKRYRIHSDKDSTLIRRVAIMLIMLCHPNSARHYNDERRTCVPNAILYQSSLSSSGYKSGLRKGQTFLLHDLIADFELQRHLGRILRRLFYSAARWLTYLVNVRSGTSRRAGQALDEPRQLPHDIHAVEPLA
jgi:hypothetical protein